MTSVAFGVVAALTLLTALLVVRVTNLVRATLWLGASLLSTAGIYAMLGASFLAGAQVMLYVGGVVTLMIFGVMTTRRHEGLAAEAESTNTGRATAVSLALFVLLAWAIHGTPGLDVPATNGVGASPEALGRALLVDHVLAFEAASVLLLAAILGAAVIARRRDPGVEVPKPGSRAAAMPHAAPEAP